MACRSNLALCKLNMKDYDTVVDQCEKVLEYDPKNLKANYRMAQAVFALSEGKSPSQIKSAYKYATKANDGIKNDEKVKAFYDEVKIKYDEVIAEEKRKAKEEEEKKKKKGVEEKLLERVKLDDIDEEGINKIEEEMKEATPELFENK